MRYEIQVDASPVIQSLAGLEGQMRFATSKALNDTANDAQKAIQDSLASRFTLRRPDFMKRTIKRDRGTDFATKEKLEAIVRVDPQRDLLAKFEDGGVKTPTNGRAIAIPTENVRRTKAQIIARTQRPRALVAAGKAYSAGGRLLLKLKQGAQAVSRVAYIFARTVRIEKRLHFVETANQAVDAQWATRATAAVDRAISTMR